MDLVSYCSIDEVQGVDYSVKKPLNREPSPKDLTCKSVSFELLLSSLLFNPANKKADPLQLHNTRQHCV